MGKTNRETKTHANGQAAATQGDATPDVSWEDAPAGTRLVFGTGREPKGRGDRAQPAAVLAVGCHPDISISISSATRRAVLDADLADILHGVEQLGSMHAYSIASKHAYSFVWGKVKGAERALGYQLLLTKGPGGSELSRQARSLLARYDSWVQDVAQLAETAFATSFQVEAPSEEAGVQAPPPETAEPDYVREGEARTDQPASDDTTSIQTRVKDGEGRRIRA